MLQPDQWKRNIIKEKRNAGESYVSKGVLRPARNVLKDPCGDTCRIQCSARFTTSERELILKDFWNLRNLTSQREYIVRHLEQITRKYAKTGKERKRCLNFSYNLYVNGQPLKVCRTFFMNTLNISDKMIRTAVEKFFRASDKLIEGELRGKHSKYNIKSKSEN